VIPISKKIMPLVREYYDTDHEFLITTSTGSGYGAFETLRQRWRDSEIPVINNHLPHDGRHTCETRLHNAGVDMYVIQRIMGHVATDVDDVYIHKTTGQLVAAIDLI
jgi:integrase